MIQTGILFFCGSLYIMALGMPRILGAITPIGGILSKTYSQLPIKLPFLLIQTGILFFCGSLYIMALGMPRILGAITPIGG
ncbi:DUF423 domain-containing protein, partial [Escherichia coli]|uniref:DUF423 domain-containing protein n=1 Tax=Escherichia coli TaxID=562 RepID=UPI003F506831